MINLDGSWYRTAAWVGIAALVAAVVVTAVRGEWLGMVILAGFLVASVAFVVAEDRLPALFDLLFVLAAIFNAGGWVWNLYDRIAPYDEIAHAYTTFAITLSFGFLAYYAVREHFVRYEALFVLAIVSFGVAVGAVWEIVEWLCDIIHLLSDTIIDLIMDTIGALAAGAVGLWALRTLPPDELSES